MGLPDSAGARAAIATAIEISLSIERLSAYISVIHGEIDVNQASNHKPRQPGHIFSCLNGQLSFRRGGGRAVPPSSHEKRRRHTKTVAQTEPIASNHAIRGRSLPE